MAEKVKEYALGIDTIETNFKKLSTSSTAKGKNEKGHDPMQLRSTVEVSNDESTDPDDPFWASVLLNISGSDNTSNIKKYKKNSSELTRRFVQTSFHVEFRQADKVFKHNCSTVEDYLEELLEFSLSNSNRKKTDEYTGKNIYDKVNVDDIIDYFRKTLPSIDWLFKHFNVDFDTSTHWSFIDMKTVYCMLDSASELDAISMEEKCKMTHDEKIKLWNERKALNFASSLDNTLKELEQKFKRKSTAYDEKYELVKELFGAIGALVDAKTRHNGSTKFSTKVFIDKNAEKTTAEEVEIIEVEITTKPDYMFVNDLQSVAYMPVEVPESLSSLANVEQTLNLCCHRSTVIHLTPHGVLHCLRVYRLLRPGDKAGRGTLPRVPSSSSGLDFSSSCLASLNLSKNQCYRLKQKMEGQHVMQLIAALHEKVKKRRRLYAHSDKLSEVGIFGVNEHVFLSKITTTAKYLDLFTRDILKTTGKYSKRTEMYSKECLASSNKYITIEYTNWNINLKTAAQRHALIIFLAHMMHVTC